LYREEGGQGQLWLIGDGPDRARLEEQARELGVGEKVKFWGSRYGEEKLNLLNHSDAFVHPSRSEGFPTGVLEAAGLGLPCLLTTETNVAEYIDRHEAGLHLPALTARAIADALHQVEAWKAEGSLDRISRNAREMVADSFSWEEIAQRLLEVYQGNDTHRSFPVTHRKTAALQG
jgi:glycosyltransferase involved in cell wall biosynthesis